MHQLGGAFNGGYDFVEQATGALGGRYAFGGQIANFFGSLLATLGEFTHLGGHYGKAFAVLASAGGFNRGIQSQEVGLVGNIVHNADFRSNLLHRLDGAGHCIATFVGFARGLDGLAVGNLGVVAVLRNRGRHLVNRCSSFFYRCGLFAGSLRQGLCCGADLSCRIEQLVGGCAYFFNNAGQLVAADIGIAFDFVKHALFITGDTLR